MFGSPISEPKEPDRAAIVFAATLVLVGGRQGSQCSIRKRKRWKKNASSAGAGGGMWSWGRLFSALALAFAFLFSSSPPLFQSVGSLGGAPPSVPRFRRAPLLPPTQNPQCGNSSARTCDDTAVHVAMTLDVAYLRGSMAAVYSVLKHASCPGDIIFHFLTTSEEGGTGEGGGGLSVVMRTSFPSLQFEVHRFDESLVRERISPSVRHALEQPLNYARNYLASLLAPCVARVIYLDSDLVVVDDITKLWKTPLHGHAIAAPEYCHANFTSYFSPAFWSDSILSATFSADHHRRAPCYFNTGVMVIDLNNWRAHGYTRKIERWMEIQKQKRIYNLGSLPPFLLLFAGNVEPVHHRWNQHGLGGDNVVGSCRPLHPGPVSLLHWSGTGKPWVRLDSGQPCPLDSLWSPYDLFLPPPHT